jgi:hypothetical protein
MVSDRKYHATQPAPVPVSWRPIEAWLGEHLPVLELSLRPGILGPRVKRRHRTHMIPQKRGGCPDGVA